MGRIVFMHRLLLTIIICSLLVSLFFVFRSIYVMSLVMTGKKIMRIKTIFAK
jgi:ABC-type multidrug transport system permease subunit